MISINSSERILKKELTKQNKPKRGKKGGKNTYTQYRNNTRTYTRAFTHAYTHNTRTYTHIHARTTKDLTTMLTCLRGTYDVLIVSLYAHVQVSLVASRVLLL